MDIKIDPNQPNNVLVYDGSTLVASLVHNPQSKTAVASNEAPEGKDWYFLHLESLHLAKIPVGTRDELIGIVERLLQNGSLSGYLTHGEKPPPSLDAAEIHVEKQPSPSEIEEFIEALIRSRQ